MKFQANIGNSGNSGNSNSYQNNNNRYSVSSSAAGAQTQTQSIPFNNDKSYNNNNSSGGGVAVADKAIPVPKQSEAFGYHLNLTAAMFAPPAPPPSADSAADTSISLVSDGVKTPTAQARQQVLSYLRNERGLNDEVILRYGVGVALHQFPHYPSDEETAEEKGKAGKMNNSNSPEWRDKVCVTFPWIQPKPKAKADANVNTTSATAIATSTATDPDQKKKTSESNQSTNQPSASERGPEAGGVEIGRVKLRALEGKGLQRLLPKGGGWGFFGWHTVQPHHKQVLITEGEYDAMAAHQGLSSLPTTHHLHPTQLPAISLPNGCNSLPPALLPMLEQFDKVYLWLDNDKPGQEAAEKFARKLGVHRCVLVRPTTESGSDNSLTQEIEQKDRDNKGKTGAGGVDSMSMSMGAPKDANDALRITIREQAHRSKIMKIKKADTIGMKKGGNGKVENQKEISISVSEDSEKSPVPGANNNNNNSNSNNANNSNSENANNIVIRPEDELIPKMLLAAQPLSHNRIETFNSLRGQVRVCLVGGVSCFTFHVSCLEI